MNRHLKLLQFGFLVGLVGLTACGGDDISVDGGGRAPQGVVFVGAKDSVGVSELYAAADDGTALIRLSQDMVQDGDVSAFELSPDGRYVAYVADQETDGINELYVAAIDGSSVTKVSGAPIPERNFSRIKWSPDSTRLVYLADQDIDNILELYLVNRDGSDNHKINGSVGSPPVVSIQGPEWSSDSRYVAYEVRSLSLFYDIGVNIHDTTIGDQDSVRVSVLPSGGRVLYFLWSPDGTRLAYLGGPSSSNIYELYLTNADGTDHHKINGSVGTTHWISQFEWSPDSRYVAYKVLQSSTNWSIGLNTHDTSVGDQDSTRVSGPLVAGGFVRIGGFQWAPDSSRLAYTADQEVALQFELYTVMPDGSGQIKVSGTMDPNGDTSSAPRWSPDGMRIAYFANPQGGSSELYITESDNSNNIIKVSVLGQNERVREDPRWSPDGLHIVYLVENSADDAIELYTTTPDGPANNARVSGPMLPEQGIYDSDDAFQWSSDSRRIVYLADQDTDDLFELYSGPAEGSGNIKISGTLVSGGAIREEFDY